MPRTLPAPAGVPLATDLARFGDRVAVLTADPAERLTYAELAARVAERTAVLGATRRLVLLAARNDVESLVTYLAALAGGHPVLLAPADKPAAVAALTEAYDPDVRAEAHSIEERRPGTRHELHPELALLLSTSGSTGSPKLVRLSADNLTANAEAVASVLGVRPDDRAATTLPLSYCYGLSVVHSHLLRGAALVLTSGSVVDPCFWQLVREHRVTSFAGVPYTFELLERAGFAAMDLPSLRYVTQAGGRMAPDRVRAVAELGRRRGWDLFVMYGQTEATARMACLPPDLAVERSGTIGLPVPGGEFRIDPVEGAEDPAVGELVYTGPNVMLGYATSPADLALGRTVTELRTGDLARRHPDGLVEVVGRRSRFVKVVGLRVDLGRLEQLLAADGLVAACAGADERVVVAVEDAAAGTGDPDSVDPDSVDPDSVDPGSVDAGPTAAAALATRIAADLGLPRGAVVVRVVPELPRLISGKPDLLAVGALADAPAAAQAPVTSTDQVRALFAELLDVAEVRDEDTFVSLGGDSLSYVEMSVRLEQALGHLPDGWHVTPVGALLPRPAARRRRGVRLETSVFLRALAIVLIVGTHAKLFSWQGTAHVLMAVAGYNFARFQLAGAGWSRARHQLRSIVRVVVPTVAVIAVGYVVTDHYTVANLVLLNAVLGTETWTTAWHFWFVEVLVYVLLAMTLLLAVPAVGRAERRWPFALPMALFAVGLLGRFAVVDLPVPHTRPVLWLFALGWATATARGPWQRVVVSLAVLLTVPGFFDDPRRDGLIVAGLLLLTWVPAVPSTRGLSRVAGVLAGASLYVYVTHWLVYPELVGVHPAVAVAASLLVGVGYWALCTRGPAALRRWRTRRPT